MIRMIAVGIVHSTEKISRRLENHGGVRPIAPRVSAWIETCVDYYAAAATYEQLSRLSDTELHRRGLARATLGRDVCGALDRYRPGHVRTGSSN